MKEIKAFIHRNRIADVVHALKAAGFQDLTVIDVKGMLKALSSQEQEYSIEIGEKVVTEVKLELVCNEERAHAAIQLIQDNAKIGNKAGGWIYISDIARVVQIH